MAAIVSTIKIIENLTGTFTKITNKIGETVNAFENMGRASKYAANTQELEKTKNKIGEITNNINRMNDQQRKFSSELKNADNNAENLLNKFKNMAQTMGALFIGKKIADYIKSSLEALTTRQNLEIQLGITLSNVGAANDAFDRLIKKASSIQEKGIFGSKAMISAAAELATYMSDVDAIERMMDTLANYAIGMSNGEQVDPRQMSNYATNLGKIVIGAYDAMTKKGFAFSESQKAIIEGTATQAQLIEVLGDKYKDLSQDMQKAETISQVINASWGNLYETMSNTPMGKITQFMNSLGGIKSAIGEKIAQSVLDFFTVLDRHLPFIKNSLIDIGSVLSPFVETLSVITDAILNLSSKIYDFLSNLAPNFAASFGIIMAIVTAVSAVGLAFNLLTNPIAQVTLAIAGIAFVIDLIIKKINDMTGKTISAAGFISGVCMVIYAGIYNIIAAIWNAVADLTKFFVDVWTHSVAAVKVLFLNLKVFFFDLAADITECWERMSSSMANSLTKALNFVISGWNKMIDLVGPELASKIGLGKANLINSTSAAVKTNKYRNFAKETRKAIENINPNNDFALPHMQIIFDAYQKGYDFGVSLENKLTENKLTSEIAKITINNPINNSNIPSDVADTARNTADTNELLASTLEELKYLRDIAEQEAINRITTSEIKIDMTNNNAINSSLDIDGVINNLTEKLTEQLDTQVLAVYNY